MIRVLVVEDETILRKGIINKIRWPELQLECVGEAVDGIDALEQIRLLRPQIVLTDIRMPGMDGLQLIAASKQGCPELKFVIISGYNDFEYARQGLRYGVSDYLLKPVDDQELHQVLVKIRGQLRQENQALNYQQFLEAYYQQYQDLVRERELTQRITGTVRGNECQLLRGDFPEALQELQFTVAIFQIEPAAPSDSRFDAAELQLWSEARRIMTDQPEAGAEAGADAGADRANLWRLVFKDAYRENEIVALLATTKDSAYARDVNLFQPWVAARLSLLKKNLAAEVTVGMGGTVDHYDLLHASYSQAQTAIKNKILKGNGRIYQYQEYQQAGLTGGRTVPAVKDSSGSGRMTLFGGAAERMLFNLLDEQRLAEADYWLETQFQQVVDTPRVTYQDLENLCLDLFALLRRYLQQKVGEADCARALILGDKQDLLAFFKELRTWQEALAEIKRETAAIIAFVAAGRARDGETIVSDVKEHIDRHYYENLSLSWVAERFFIHPNYFSKLFKEKWGESFKDYLTRVRMNRVYELMQDPALKIEQIAQMVGYDDPAYFSSLFRKISGVSPTKFREDLHDSHR